MLTFRKVYNLSRCVALCFLVLLARHLLRDPPGSTSPGSGRQVPAAAGPGDGGPRGEGAGAVRRLPPRHGPLRAAAVRVVGAAAGLVPRVQGGLHQLDAAPAASGRPQ